MESKENFFVGTKWNDWTDLLAQVAKALKVPKEAIQNFEESAAINIISNTFSEFKDIAIGSAMNYQCSFNTITIDKVVELFERMLKEKNEMIEKLGKLKKNNRMRIKKLNLNNFYFIN